MQVNSAFVLRNICDKFILMPIKTNNASNDPILLNDVAAYIWKAAGVHTSRKELLDRIGQEYGLSENSPEMTAVENFTSLMLDMGLILDDREIV